MDYIQTVKTYLVGEGLLPQLLLTVVVLLVFYVAITSLESIVDGVKRLDRTATTLMGDTVTSKHLIPQMPGGSAPLIYNSENEANGMEFTYSMYLFISPETFGEQSTSSGGAKKLKHIFHKGSKAGFPLLGPGLFVESDKNTLRMYMNSSTKWDTYVEIPNIPVGKWFHLVATMKGKYMDVYVNGNVAVRHEFATVPKINFGHVYIMHPIRFQKTLADNEVFEIDGAAKGMVSRLKYYAYALNYAEIDSLYREGPSKVIVSPTFTETPPYLRDDWWVTRY